MSKTTISDFVIGFLDLLEAEGRTLRKATVQIGWGLAFILVAALLAAAALGMLLWGVYQYLAAWLNPAAAALLLSLATLVLAGIFAWLAKWQTR